jgi:hypothetical protein
MLSNTPNLMKKQAFNAASGRLGHLMRLPVPSRWLGHVIVVAKDNVGVLVQ